MTRLLEEAFAAASRLADADQDALARLVLDELRSEQAWDAAFAASPDVLEELAAEALAEKRAGKAPPLDPNRL